MFGWHEYPYNSLIKRVILKFKFFYLKYFLPYSFHTNFEGKMTKSKIRNHILNASHLPTKQSRENETRSKESKDKFYSPRI